MRKDLCRWGFGLKKKTPSCPSIGKGGMNPLEARPNPNLYPMGLKLHKTQDMCEGQPHNLWIQNTCLAATCTSPMYWRGCQPQSLPRPPSYLLTLFLEMLLIVQHPPSSLCWVQCCAMFVQNAFFLLPYSPSRACRRVHEWDSITLPLLLWAEALVLPCPSNHNDVRIYLKWYFQRKCKWIFALAQRVRVRAGGGGMHDTWCKIGGFLSPFCLGRWLIMLAVSSGAILMPFPPPILALYYCQVVCPHCWACSYILTPLHHMEVLKQQNNKRSCPIPCQHDNA